jgi:hypothetical protein
MKEKIAVLSAVLLGAVVGLFATISLIIDAFVLDNLTGTIIDLCVMGFSYLTAWVGLRYVLMEKIAEDRMDKEWNYKIAPVVDLLTDTIGRVQGLEIDIMKTNRKIDTTLDYVAKIQDMDASSVYIFPGASFKFITKVMVMIIFTFSALVYVTAYPLSIVHYFILVLYLGWWALFTSEFHLFENKNAWIWGMAPIMTVPTGGIILDATLGLNNMVGILFFLLFLYAYLYYSWAAALTIGFKLIDLHKIHDYIIKHTDVYVKKQKVDVKINRRHIDIAILLCIAVAGVIAVMVFI